MSRYYAFKDETERCGGEETAVGQHPQQTRVHHDLRVQTDGENGPVLAELPRFHDQKPEPVLDAPRIERARSTDPEETGETTHFDDLVSVDLVGQPLPQQYGRSHRRSRTGNGDTGHHTRESSLSSPVSCSSLSHSPTHATPTHPHTHTRHHGQPESHAAAAAALQSSGKRAASHATTSSSGEAEEKERRSANRPFGVKAGLVGGIGGLLSGYEMSILSAALPGISQKFGSLLDEEEALGSVLLVGALCGSISGGWVSDRVGRWRAVVLTALIFITGSIFGGAAQSYGALLWARFAVGVGVAWGAVTNVALLTEVSPSEHRGAVVSAYELMFSLGVLVSYGVGLLLDEMPGGWRAMLYATSVFAAAGILCMCVWLPESPAWLVHTRQAPSDALSALQRVYGHDARRAEEELERLRAAAAHSSTTDAAPIGTFKAYTHQILIAAGLMAAQELMGTIGVMTFAHLMLQHVGMTRKAAQVATVIMCTFKPLATLMTITTFHTSANAPRLTYLIWGGLYMGASLLLCSFAFSMTLGSKVSQALLFAGVSSFLCWHSYSFGPVTRLIASELFPAAIRGRALGITTVATWACALLIVRTFVPIMDLVGLRDGFLLFAAMCVVASAYVYLGVPETASKTPEEVSQRLAVLRSKRLWSWWLSSAIAHARTNTRTQRRPRTQPLHQQSHWVSDGGDSDSDDDVWVRDKHARAHAHAHAHGGRHLHETIFGEERKSCTPPPQQEGEDDAIPPPLVEQEGETESVEWEMTDDVEGEEGVAGVRELKGGIDDCGCGPEVSDVSGSGSEGAPGGCELDINGHQGSCTSVSLPPRHPDKLSSERAGAQPVPITTTSGNSFEVSSSSNDIAST